MHFLGLAGMPRRIPDFPAAYTQLNTIASIGSVITMVSTTFFMYIIFATLTANDRVGCNPWAKVKAA
jgi:heme/copper-type cytochrome/quinol oxidase subunit 1